ncbi:glycosyltransferase [Rhizobium sp. LjRoot30]|uniref:glycosyltransferase n=1 Tax=Rhizobium sp. LjRoot30 TaxID=3342320 RepID=UPI003ED0D71C
MAPLLSICVPSRNRQKYFKKTIEWMLKSTLDNVQFVFTDNSDDPGIMNTYMADIVANDPRVVFLPSVETTLSMVDNWERTVAASTGDWIVVVGDDDYVDPNVATMIESVTKVEPNLEGFAWSIIGYHWPYEGREKQSVLVSLEQYVYKVSHTDLFGRMFGWREATHTPTSGFSIYHTAISRSLLEKIKRTYGGRYFEHPVVDYDNAFKVICSGRNFAVCGRPFSIMGSCPESNSFSIGKMELFKKTTTKFIEEAGRDFEDDPDVRDFPFKSILGTPATIMQAQNWFKQKYKLKYEGWEKHFVKACANEVFVYPDREAYDLACEGYRAALRAWKGGKHLKDFEPKFQGDGCGVFATGFTSDSVYIDSNIAATPGELFSIVEDMVVAAKDIKVDQTGLRYYMGNDKSQEPETGKAAYKKAGSRHR